MDVILNPALAIVRMIDWHGPEAYVMIVFAFLALKGKFGMLFIGIVTFVLGHMAHDYIIMNIHTSEMLVGIPLIIYCTGGAFAASLGAIALLKYMIA